MSDLYEDDILLWSEREAERLRRLAAGEPQNETPDWANIIEEIESVGRSEFHSVEGFLTQAMAHRLKALAWPHSREVEGWLAEAHGFLGDAAARYTPSMRQRLDLPKLYRRALRRLPLAIDGQPPLSLPVVCPFTLDELLADDQP